MQATKPAWVLGHRIRMWDTDDSYGLVEITSPPGIPGPPPHFHKEAREFFLILKGRLEVMADGAWSTMAPGAYVELPPGTVHTFINKGGEDAVWVTGWRPKGFQRFFAEFGIPCEAEGARERSVSDEVVRRVAAGCERFGMFLSKG